MEWSHVYCRHHFILRLFICTNFFLANNNQTQLAQCHYPLGACVLLLGGYCLQFLLLRNSFMKLAVDPALLHLRRTLVPHIGYQLFN